jgi:hypothetical protein
VLAASGADADDVAPMRGKVTQNVPFRRSGKAVLLFWDMVISMGTNGSDPGTDSVSAIRFLFLFQMNKTKVNERVQHMKFI